MPRQPRLDAPGHLQHVMARGIERREIFRDDKDRNSFLDRLATILEETQTQCYAWALIPNHFHLLLRTGPTPLSKVMRRLMTGYAVTFNKRHKRTGHLFQNRYKSVICEEDPYLLELIRYIHLNPLRSGLVKDLKELDRYPWSGHSTILGKKKNPLILPDKSNKHKKEKIFTPLNTTDVGHLTVAENPACPVAPADGTGVNPVRNISLVEKTIEDVLLHFGETKRVARRRYRRFVKNGIDQGTRQDLQGGGLVRSAGGDKRGLLGRKREEREKGDERILGSGDYVNEVLKKAGEEFESGTKKRMPLEKLMAIVASSIGISVEDLKSTRRKRNFTSARAIVTYIAVENLGYKGVEIAKALSLSPPTVSHNIDKGKILLDMNKELKLKLQ